jgi:hypothetical protein
MSQQPMYSIQPCAELEPHEGHTWGWKKRCPGRVDDEGVPPMIVERAAEAYWNYYQSVVHKGETPPLWEDTPQWNRNRIKACIRAALEAVRDDM